MNFIETADTKFFENLARFGAAPAIIDAGTKETLSYEQLETQVAARAAELGEQRSLIFIEAKNSIGSITDYLACLRGGHVVYLTEDLQAEKIKELVTFYAPNILIDGSRTIIRHNDKPLALHPDLALLLSTSGSTGSPKFVKLSVRNIDSNARSICAYLELNGSERAFQHLKPHYSYGLSIINSHIACGAALILTHHGVIDNEFWQEFKEFEATSFAGVPYTFETLKHRSFHVTDYPSLRYVTQAGGKLEAHLVAAFADMFAANGKRFYVMYGQTEAAPRISYLPPALAQKSPGSIGKSIPGGKLYLIDETGAEITAQEKQGELAYEGPNVMMGYATSPEEMSTDETPPRLLTGDIAVIREDGLFFIVGRSSRFVKPFGVRVNLDEVQSFVKRQHGTCAVTGDDKAIVIAMEGDAKTTAKLDIKELVERFGLPGHIYTVRPYSSLPLLSSGKYDFQRILRDASGPVAEGSLLSRVVSGVMEILGLNQSNWSSITEIYAALLPGNEITDDKCFRDMTVDSLAFVALAIELEDIFKDKLPENWQDMPIGELEQHYREMVIKSAAA